MKTFLALVCGLGVGASAHAQQLLSERVLMSRPSQSYFISTDLLAVQPDSLRLTTEYRPATPSTGSGVSGTPAYIRLLRALPAACDTLPTSARTPFIGQARLVTSMNFPTLSRTVRRGQVLTATVIRTTTQWAIGGDSAGLRVSLFGRDGHLQWTRLLPPLTYQVESAAGLLDAPNGDYYVCNGGTLLRLDSLGNVRWRHVYHVGELHSPVYTRWGTLLVALTSFSSAINIAVMEINQHGDSLTTRRVTPNPLETGTLYTQAERTFLQPLRDGGFSLAGMTDSAGYFRPFLARLDANLNVRWTYTYRPQATRFFRFVHPCELADGSLVVLATNNLSGLNAPYWLFRFSALGALQQRYAFASQVLPLNPATRLGTFGQLRGLVPLSDSSFMVASSYYLYGRTTAQDQALTYLAHLRVPGLPRVVDSHYIPAAMPTATRPAARLNWQLYPNPASETLNMRYTLPPGSGPAQLRCTDALGRQVHTQAVPPGTAAATVAVAAWPPGLYVLTLEANGQVLARQRVSVYRE